jgi:TRAP transporter 4TM/12TM fusion protein
MPDKAEGVAINTPRGIVPDKTKAILQKIILVLSIFMAIFQFYSAAYKPFTSMIQRPVHLTLALVLLWLYDAMKQEKLIMRLNDYALCIISVAMNLYIMSNWLAISRRTTAMTTLDIVVGIAVVVMVLLATWKSVSVWMMLVGSLFLAYAYFGPMLSGIFRFKGISLMRALASIVMSSEGVYGSTLAVSATYVFMFIMFGDFLLLYGAGQFFIDLAQSAFGRFRGGSSKVAVLASGLFGMVSGSGTANVMGTGAFTVPLIKKSGYGAEYAGGMVAAAATGGLIMPPVMGAAAFLMAEFLRVPYGSLCIFAAIPAVYYFINLFVVADLRAIRIGDLGLDKDEMPAGKKVLKEGWHYLICIFVLALFLCVLRWSASKSCVYAIAALLVSDYAKRLLSREKISWKAEGKKLVAIAINSCKSSIVVAMSCACSGVIVGVFSSTGLNLRFSGLLVALAGGNMLILLILSMIGALILGMGMPSVSVYILMAIIVAPALVNMGITPLSAHMFLFYFGILAPITPPVGICFYAASSIANSKPMQTGFAAWRMALPGFILPFLFVYDPAIMMQGSPLEILWTLFYCLAGLVGMAFGLEGNLGKRVVNPVFRVLMVGFAIATVVPELYSTLIGLAGLTVLFAIVMLKGKMIVPARTTTHSALQE